jgi:hypothetical protein
MPIGGISDPPVPVVGNPVLGGEGAVGARPPVPVPPVPPVPVPVPVPVQAR